MQLSPLGFYICYRIRHLVPYPVLVVILHALRRNRLNPNTRLGKSNYSIKRTARLADTSDRDPDISLLEHMTLLFFVKQNHDRHDDNE